mgnify:CR=1 FL=1
MSNITILYKGKFVQVDMVDETIELTVEDNVLYKFNSTEGGVIVPRGCSVVGTDLRRTKIIPT